MTKKTKSITALDVLVKARDLIKRKGWAKEFYATTKTGEPAKYYSRSAANFCIMGACYRAMNGTAKDKAIDIGDDFNSATDTPLVLDAFAWLSRTAKFSDWSGGELSSWNDTPGRKKAQVIALFDKAIARLKKELP